VTIDPSTGAVTGTPTTAASGIGGLSITSAPRLHGRRTDDLTRKSRLLFSDGNMKPYQELLKPGWYYRSPNGCFPRARISVSIASPTRACTVRSSPIISTAPIVGFDRCDPTNKATSSDKCRSAVAAPSRGLNAPAMNTVSPEGRLLVLTYSNHGSSTNYSAGGQLANTLGLNDPNGPADQLAGALRDQALQDAAAAAAGAAAQTIKPGSSPGALPAIILPPSR
jgi:hypothetical protein